MTVTGEYDPHAVEEFVRDFERSVILTAEFMALLGGGRLVSVITRQKMVAFDRLTPWERANVAFELERIAQQHLKAAQDWLVSRARESDDQRVQVVDCHT